MADEQHDTGAIAQATGYCTTKPVPGTFLTLPTLVNPCPDCGHAALLHIGVDHCPVCELEDLNQRNRDLIAKGQVEITINGRPPDDRYIEGVLLRQARRYGTVRGLRR